MNALALFVTTHFASRLPHWLRSIARFEHPKLIHFALLALCHFALQTLWLFFDDSTARWLFPGIHSLFITLLGLLCFIKPLRHSNLGSVLQLAWLNAYLVMMAMLAGEKTNFTWFFYCQIWATLMLTILNLLVRRELAHSQALLVRFTTKMIMVIVVPIAAIVIVNSPQLVSILPSSTAIPLTTVASDLPFAIVLFQSFLHGVVALYILALLKPVLSPYVKARLIEYIQQDFSIHQNMMTGRAQKTTHSTDVANTFGARKSKPSAQYLDQVSILFADMENFSELMQHHATDQVVAFLHDVFNEFDNLCSEFGVAKIKTVGDQYMAAAGVPFPHTNHAYHCCLLALAMRAQFSTICRKHKMNTALRIGISSGSVVAGFVGNDKRSYDLWGDAVNLAARMESRGEAHKIQLSHSTYQLVSQQFTFEPERQISVKGFGKTRCYYLKDFPNETQSGRHKLLTTILAKAT